MKLPKTKPIALSTYLSFFPNPPYESVTGSRRRVVSVCTVLCVCLKGQEGGVIQHIQIDERNSQLYLFLRETPLCCCVLLFQPARLSFPSAQIRTPFPAQLFWSKPWNVFPVPDKIGSPLLFRLVMWTHTPEQTVVKTLTKAKWVGCQANMKRLQNDLTLSFWNVLKRTHKQWITP